MEPEMFCHPQFLVTWNNIVSRVVSSPDKNNTMKKVNMIHLYCLAGQVGFYSDMVACCPVTQAARVRSPAAALVIKCFSYVTHFFSPATCACKIFLPSCLLDLVPLEHPFCSTVFAGINLNFMHIASLRNGSGLGYKTGLVVWCWLLLCRCRQQ